MPVSAELVGGPFDGLRVDLERDNQHSLQFPNTDFSLFPLQDEPLDLRLSISHHVYIRGEERVKNRFRFYYQRP